MFNAVGIPFLERMIDSPIEDEYSSSYPSVAFSFLLWYDYYFIVISSFCDIPSFQLKIASLLTTVLKVLKNSKNDELRRDALTILSSLSSNSNILNVFYFFKYHLRFYSIVFLYLIFLVTALYYPKNLLRIPQKNHYSRSKSFNSLFISSIDFIHYLIQQLPQDYGDATLLLALLQ